MPLYEDRAWLRQRRRVLERVVDGRSRRVPICEAVPVQLQPDAELLPQRPGESLALLAPFFTPPKAGERTLYRTQAREALDRLLAHGAGGEEISMVMLGATEDLNNSGQGGLGAGEHVQWRGREPHRVDADQRTRSPPKAAHASAAQAGHATAMTVRQ